MENVNKILDWLLYRSLNKQKPVTLWLIFFAIGVAGCKKFVEINPPGTSITAATVYANNKTAAAVMTGIYSSMVYKFQFGMSDGQGSLGYLMGQAADELTNYSPSTVTNQQFFTNTLSSNTNGKSN